MATATKEKTPKVRLVEKKDDAAPVKLQISEAEPAKAKKKVPAKAIAPHEVIAMPVKVKKSVLKMGKGKSSFNPEIVEKLKKIIAPYTEHPELLKHIEKDTNVNFVDKLNIDSVDVVEIVVDVEEEFKITIADKEIETFKTFEDMYNLIEAKINEVANGSALAKAV